MLAPVPGSTLGPGVVTFSWSPGAGVSAYALWVGRTPGGYDQWASYEGTNRVRSVQISLTDQPVYVTLWSLVGGVYSPVTYTYGTPSSVPARITSPVNGSTLGSTDMALLWDSGRYVSRIALWVGTAVDGYDLFAGIVTGGMHDITVPANQPKIYVTLWSLIDNTWKPNRYVFMVPQQQSAEKSYIRLPSLGSSVAGVAVVEWGRGAGVSRKALWLGSAYGGYDIAAVDVSLGTSRTLAVPQDGGPVYVTLWSFINGGWQADRSWFYSIAASGRDNPAVVTSPINTSVLTTTELNLTWDDDFRLPPYVDHYALWVGSVPDGYDLYAGYVDAVRSKTVFVPGDGRRVYVTLFTLFSGQWQSNSYYYTAPVLPDGGAAQVTSPLPGSVFNSDTLPLQWNGAAGASQYYLFVGTAPGAFDYYIGSQGMSQNRTITGLPTDGRTVYVTLYSLLNGVWKPSSAWFTAANTASGNKPALINTPANDTVLAGASNTLTWGGGVGVTSHALWIGSSARSYDLWASSESASLTSRIVTLPTDGRKVHVTLWSLIGGTWQSVSYLYTAANVIPQKAMVVAPAPGASLSGASETFIWTAGSGASGYALWIGRKPGGYDVYSGNEGTNTSKTVTTLPTDGSPVYVTLWSFIKGTWQSSDGIYSAWLAP